jgi:plasmid maintenance system antidote protein VapI
MKIEISKASNPLAELFSAPLSIEGEADYLKMMFVEDLLALLKEQGVSRTELARRMEVQPSRITSMLTGTNNFTIETMVRAGRAVGANLHQKLAPATKKLRWQVWEKAEQGGFFCVAPVRHIASEPVTFELNEFTHDDTSIAA